jgi:hypothetical protein
LVWRNRKKISQIINAYLYLLFFLLIILWWVGFCGKYSNETDDPIKNVKAKLIGNELNLTSFFKHKLVDKMAAEIQAGSVTYGNTYREKSGTNPAKFLRK